MGYSEYRVIPAYAYSYFITISTHNEQLIIGDIKINIYGLFVILCITEQTREGRYDQ